MLYLPIHVILYFKQIKNGGIQMNIRRIFFSSILLTIITLVGCSNQEYDDAMDQGMKAVDDEQFKDALEYFEEALAEKPDDNEATASIEQTELIIKSIEKLIDEETSEAISILEKAIELKDDSESTTKKANEILENVVTMDEKLHQIDDLKEEGKYEETLELIDESLEKDSEKLYMAPFKKQLTSLEEEVKKAQLFSYIEGYSRNDNDDMEVCQITEDDIICTVLTVDLYYLADIESIELQSDDTLEIEMVDDSNVIISNITKESYDMHERTFKNITEKDIKNQLPEYYTIDNLFNKETIKDILENAPGNHNLFEFGEQAEESTQTEENSQAEENTGTNFDGYSDEEIEYARVWLDYVNGPNPPQLTVIFEDKGTPINPYVEDENIVYPEDVTVLVGEFTADGKVTYSSNGDGTINVYDVPSHWHQQSDAEMKEATKNVLETIKKKEVPTGNDEQVLNILENMIVEK